jgi:O-antigen/teichoic acid export membrane protein
MLASFLVGVQLARGLGVEAYGYYGIALSVITLAGIPSELGLPRLVTREVAAAVGRKDQPYLFAVLSWANRTSIKIAGAVALMVACGALFLTGDHPSQVALGVLLGAPVIPLLSLANIRSGALQGLHHIVLGQISAQLLRPLFLSLLLLLTYVVGISVGAPTAMALNSVGAVAVLLVTNAWLKRRLPPFTRAETIHNSRRWIGSAIPMALTEGMRIVQAELSIVLVAIITAPTAVGLFRIATATAAIAFAPMMVVGQVAAPVIARLYAENDHDRLQKLVFNAAWAQLAGVLLLSLPLVVAAEPLLSLIFGPSYVPAGNALRIVALGQIANAAFGPNVTLLNMTSHEKRVTRAMAIALSLNIALVPLLVVLWGIEGAAAAFIVSMLSWNILAWRDGKRLLGIETSPLLARLF